MLSATEARTNAAAKAEENKVKFESEADAFLETSIDPVIAQAVEDGATFVSVALPVECNEKVSEIVYEKLAQAGYDVVVSADSDAGINWITLYWAKDRGENPGHISRPKLAVL